MVIDALFSCLVPSCCACLPFQLEEKLRKALAEVEARERQLKAREESWRSDHAQKLSELQLLQRRLREETKHQVP